MNKYQEEKFKTYDPKKPVYFKQRVVDCEHSGDMRQGERELEEFLKKYHGVITYLYWDGKDCGEAWIECCVPFEYARAVVETNYFYYDNWQ